ncbi:MAG: glucosylceramidase [Polyangiaceae bacterium]|nr:glucosylceramidase [Polyangiaceae bacterium]
MRWCLRYLTLGILAFAALASCQMLAGLGDRSMGTGSGDSVGQGGAAGADAAAASGREEGPDERANGGRAGEPLGDETGLAGEANEGDGAGTRAADGNATGGTESGGAEPAGANTGGDATAGGKTGGAAVGGLSAGGAESGGLAMGGDSTGGSAAGGAESGGQVTGGDSTGGSAAGGAESGGQAMGGDGTGGSATGGAESGGQAAGGDGTGGSATGGAESGGTSAGGNPTGGAATGGSPTAPELITSGPNDYWNTAGQVTEVTSTIADLTVNENNMYQVWSGFGGTFNEMGWDALSVVSPEVTNALRLLFDAQEGANFVFGRIPIGASDYAMSWYTLDDSADDYEMEHFSIARDHEKLIPYIKAAQQARPDLRLWASPWIPPDWMTNGSGNMKNDAQTLQAYALYLARFVEAYANEGLAIEAIHPQDEPGYARVHWTQSLFIEFIKTYLGPTFAGRNVTAEIWCGTMSAPEDANIATALAADEDAMDYVKGFGLQWNLQSTVAALSPRGPVMQTEHRCGNYSFTADYWDQSRYDPNKAQNDHLYGEESWQLIRDWIVAGVNSYCAWNMVLDTVGKSLDGWPQNALLVVDRSAKKLIPTAAYYVFRHFSRYIAPGSTRIEASGNNDAVAFKNPDGSIVTQVYNKGDASRKMTVKIGSAFNQFDVPAHGWATLITPP